MVTCGEALVAMLEAAGIDTVFGIPGVHTVELYRGLARSGIHHVTPRHEQGAGFMADGYARVRGRPAACFVITGPGVTNIATAMGQAYGDSVPMLVISSVNRTGELGLGEGRLHELKSQRDLSAGVTAFSHTVTDPAELPAVLARAFRVFRSERPRPVHIQLPTDVIARPLDAPPAFRLPAPDRPAPDEKQIEQAAQWLNQAEHPLVILGGGAQDAVSEARALVKRLGAPAVTTINGKGILEPGDLFNAGGNLCQAPVLEALSDADVVLAVGTELGETDTLLFGGRLELNGRLIRVDIDPGQLGRNAPAALAITADSKQALAALERAVESPANRNAGEGRARSLKARMEQDLSDEQRRHRRIMNAVDAALPDAVVVGDSTQLIYSANLFYAPRVPRSYFNSATGYGTLGYALPAAVGAKLAAPARPVVCVIGDGGFMFTLGELAAAVELELPLAVLLWNNRGYGEIKKHMAERKIPQVGVDIYTPNLRAIAAGFGCRAARAETLDELTVLLRESPSVGAPTIIEVDESDASGW